MSLYDGQHIVELKPGLALITQTQRDGTVHPQSIVSCLFPATDKIERIVMLVELYYEAFPIWAGATVGDNSDLVAVEMEPRAEYASGTYVTVTTLWLHYRDGKVELMSRSLDEQM